MSPDHQKQMPRYRKLGIKIITWLLNVGSETKASDSQSGFRAYSRRLVDALPISEKGMGVSVEVIARARRARFTIREVPITCIYHRESFYHEPVDSWNERGSCYASLQGCLLEPLTRGHLE